MHVCRLTVTNYGPTFGRRQNVVVVNYFFGDDKSMVEPCSPRLLMMHLLDASVECVKLLGPTLRQEAGTWLDIK